MFKTITFEQVLNIFYQISGKLIILNEKMFHKVSEINYRVKTK